MTGMEWIALGIAAGIMAGSSGSPGQAKCHMVRPMARGRGLSKCLLERSKHHFHFSCHYRAHGTDLWLQSARF